MWIEFYVLLDLKMPKMGGFEACKTIKSQDPRTKQSVVVAFTALDVDRKLLEDAGFDGYFKKPFNAQDLLQAIAKYLGETKTQKN